MTQKRAILRSPFQGIINTDRAVDVGRRYTQRRTWNQNVLEMIALKNEDRMQEDRNKTE